MLEEGYSIPRIPPNGTLKDTIPKDFLVLLRALTLPIEDLNRLKARNKAPKPEFSTSEASLLRSLVTCRQSEYPTSVQEDESILRCLEQQNGYINDSIPIRKKMAVQVRKGEKEILTQILTLLDTQDTHLVQPDQNGSTKRSMTDDEKSSKRKRQL